MGDFYPVYGPLSNFNLHSFSSIYNIVSLIQTNKQRKQMELLQTFKYGTLKVETFYQGSNVLPVKIYVNDELAEENTFKPGAAQNIDATQSMVDLLSFITLRRGDTDDEYFDERNSPLLDKWSETLERDEVLLLCDDFEQKVSTEIEKYITTH